MTNRFQLGKVFATIVMGSASAVFSGDSLDLVTGELDKLSPITVPSLVEKLRASVGTKFTLSHSSLSNQGPIRGLLMGQDAAAVVGIPGAANGAIEMVEDNDGDIVNYSISLGPQHGPKGYHVDRDPKECKSCHGPKFAYIWPEYDNDAIKKTWHGFLGEADDRVDPASEQFKALCAHPNFVGLFKDQKRESFPYWQTHVAEVSEEVDSGLGNSALLPRPPDGKFNSYRERKELIGHLPNETLSKFLGARAARSLALRAQSLHPDRYKKYRFVLVSLVMGCAKSKQLPDGSWVHDDTLAQEAGKALRVDFQKALPRRNEIWSTLESRLEKKGEVSNQTRERLLLLQLLDYLGVSPDSIILTEPRSSELNLHDPDQFLAFLSTYADKSPMEYNVGGDALKSYVGRYLEGWFEKAIELRPDFYSPENDLAKTIEAAPLLCPRVMTEAIDRLRDKPGEGPKENKPLRNSPKLPTHGKGEPRD